MSKRKKAKKRSRRGPTEAEPHEQRPDSASEVLAQELGKELGIELSPQAVARLGRLVETRVELVVQETLVTRFSGPLPHPDVLAEYDRISPGLLERIVKMAESQADHRQMLEATVVRGNTWMGRAGVVFGGIIGILGLLVISLAIYVDAPLQYLGGILTALAALAGLFLWSRRKKVRDAEKLQRGMKEIFKASVASDPKKEASASVPAQPRQRATPIASPPRPKSGS